MTAQNLDAILLACQIANIEISYLVYRTTRKQAGALFSSGISSTFSVLEGELSGKPPGAERTRLCTVLIFHHLLAAFTLGTTWLFCREHS